MSGTYLIPTAPDLPFPLGRAGVNHDPRNLNFRALTKPPPRRQPAAAGQVWPTRTVFDQGNSPRCTTEAAIGLLRTSPYAKDFTERANYDDPAERQAAYLDWQRYDPWYPAVHDGSSSDAPFRGLRAAGVIPGWHWLFGEAEVREWLTLYSACVLGIKWSMGMFYPDPKTGYLNVTGEIVGGHEILAVQYSKARDAYRLLNSWGPGWGQHGRAWMRAADLRAKLADDGDATTLAVGP